MTSRENDLFTLVAAIIIIINSIMFSFGLSMWSLEK